MTDPVRIDHVEALQHLPIEGVLSSMDLDDHEGLAIRAALNIWGLSLNPPCVGNVAIRAALKEHLVSAGLWPAPRRSVDE